MQLPVESRVTSPFIRMAKLSTYNFCKLLKNMKKIFVLIVFSLAYWCANALEAGLYYIRSVINKNYVIDNNARGVQDGNNLQLWEFNGSVAQKWIVVPNAEGSYLFINLT